MTPPVTDRAEMAVVAALLRDNSAVEACAGLEQAHFSDALSGALFAAVRDKIGAGEIATPSTMQAWAAAKGVPFQALVNAHASGLDALPFVAANVLAVRRGASLRGLQGVLSGNLESISPDAEPLEALARVEADLRGLDMAAVGTDISAREAGDRAIANLSAPRGWRTGYDDLDAGLTGFRGGQLVLIAGAPGQCKSALATNLARKAASKHGKKLHYASYEMGDCDIGERLVSAAAYECGALIPYFDFQNKPGELSERWRELSKFAEKIPDTLRLEISGPQSLAGLEASARATRRKLDGLDGIFVDYLQLMSAMSKRASIYERTTEISQGLKALAKRLNVPVIALTQISRENTKRGSNRRPRLSDLRDSGALEQDADLVLAVHRESYWLTQDGVPAEGGDEALFRYEADVARWENVLEVIRLKQRQGPTGSTYLRVLEQFDVIENAPHEMKERLKEKVSPRKAPPKMNDQRKFGGRQWVD